MCVVVGIICLWFFKRWNKYWYEFVKNSVVFYKELVGMFEGDIGWNLGYK